jgi:NADPH:quinone reductase-like Zn-dependent oxidoreductase
MKAAVVTSFTEAPAYGDFRDAVVSRPDQMVVDVLAAGLHPLVRGQASGPRPGRKVVLPFVPGVDGVGRGEDGVLRYFTFPDETFGTMAERTVIIPRRSIELPVGTDPVAVAAAMNPAMSSWIALRRRISFEAGQKVLVLGATGVAGRMAVQVAGLLGASQVIAAGRDRERLADVRGATETVLLQDTDALVQVAGEVDVVLDYVWGPATGETMRALTMSRRTEDQPLSWVQIGTVGGPIGHIAAPPLRSIPLQIVGSGLGSVSGPAMLAELPALLTQIANGAIDVDAKAVALSEVNHVWTQPESGPQRIVFVPGQ